MIMRYSFILEINVKHMFSHHIFKKTILQFTENPISQENLRFEARSRFIEQLLKHLTEQRDLAIARGCRNLQPIRDYYLIRVMLETGVRVQECCDLVDSDFSGHKLIVRCGKGGKSRTILLTRATANLINLYAHACGSIDEVDLFKR